MKIFNIFDDGTLIASADETTFPLYVEWKKKQLLEEAKELHDRLAQHEYTLTEPEWFMSQKEFGFRYTSHHPSYGKQKPHVEKHAVQWMEQRLWTPDQTEPFDINEEIVKRKPVAWYIRRNAPGKHDDGRRMGPFWKEADADDWVDENHTKHPLYD